MPLAPPKWLPPDEVDLWDRAVKVFEDSGREPTYGGVVKVYELFRNREGRDKQQKLPGFDDMNLAPDEGKIIRTLREDSAKPGSKSIDERAQVIGFKAVAHYRIKKAEGSYVRDTLSTLSNIEKEIGYIAMPFGGALQVQWESAVQSIRAAVSELKDMASKGAIGQDYEEYGGAGASRPE